MRKYIILAFALMLSTVSIAQKKELKALEKAVSKQDYAEANNLLNTLKGMVPAMDEKQKSTYHLNRAMVVMYNISQAGSGFSDEATIDSGIESLNIAEKHYGEQVGGIKQSLENLALPQANDMYTNGNYAAATQGFEFLYKLVPADTTYLYYAASSAVSGKDYDTALEHYLKLNEMGYTGIEMQYYATNAETGEEELMNKQQRDLLVKTGNYIKPTQRKTTSKKGEIIKNMAFIYVNQGKTTEALAAIKEARQNEPNEVSLILTEANLYYQTGDLESYKNLIEEAIKLDPENLDLIFNLGVISADNKDLDKAKEYYQRVIDLDPGYVNALTNMAALILEEEQTIIEEMNGLGTSAAENKRYDELKEERVGVYRAAIPYLEGVLKVEPNNVDVARTLMNIFSAVDDNAKYEEMKALIDSMKD